MENIFESVDKKLKKLREVVGNKEPSLNNTSDEKNLETALEKSPVLIARLKNIQQPNELDGFFQILLNKTGIEDSSKQMIILALRKALDNSSPNNPTFTSPITKNANNTKQPTSSPTKINESFKRMQELAGTINEALKPSAYRGGWYSPSVNKPEKTEKPSKKASVVTYYQTYFKDGGAEGLKQEIPDIKIGEDYLMGDTFHWVLVLSSDTVDLNTPESFDIIKKYLKFRKS